MPALEDRHDALLRFCLARQLLAGALMGWQATRPDPDDVDEELAGTRSQLTQLVRLARMGGGRVP